MKLRTKLLLALAPLVVALASVGVMAALVTTRLADQSRLILADNYRSVLAAQRMKEALERIDSGVLFVLAGHDQAEAITGHRRTFESELRRSFAPDATPFLTMIVCPSPCVAPNLTA